MTTQHETKIAVLESQQDHIHTLLTRIDRDIHDMRDSVTTKLEKIDTRLDKLDSRLWYIAFFLITTYGSALVYLLKEGAK